MHRLVQFSTRTWLVILDELQSWQERYIDILGAAVPAGNYANWATCQALFPHVEAMEMHGVRSTDHLQVWARVLYNGACYAKERGQYGLAERMARANLEVRQEVLGLDYTATLVSINLLASVLRRRGQYKEVEEMNRRALAGKEKELDANHPDTLASVLLPTYSAQLKTITRLLNSISGRWSSMTRCLVQSILPPWLASETGR